LGIAAFLFYHFKSL
jgi:hypothetical protein